MTDITERLRRLYTDTGMNYVQEAADTIETLRQRVNELEDYLREVAVEAGLPPETLDIATCRHIAHQVKYIRNAAVQYMDELTVLKQTSAQWHNYYRRQHHQRCDLLEAAGTDSLGNKCTCLECIEQELAALKQQGDPVAWLTYTDNGLPMLWTDLPEATLYCDDDETPTPLYTAPPDCFSAGDMADAQAKAFSAGVRGK